MKALPEYYIKAVELAAEASVLTIGKSYRLPDINTPHNYLMRSKITARINGGYLFSWQCRREDKTFAGMGGISIESLEKLLPRIRGAFNRQHKGGTSDRSLSQLAKRARGY